MRCAGSLVFALMLVYQGGLAGSGDLLTGGIAPGPAYALALR